MSSLDTAAMPGGASGPHPASLLPLLRQSLATARLTRLITSDRIFDAPRAKISEVHPTVEYLVHCPVCTGVWAAAVIRIADRTPVLRTGVWMLAVAQGGLMADRAVDAMG